MKIYYRQIFYLLFIIIISSKGISQNSSLAYTVELSSYLSTNSTLPFWLTANTHDAVPTTNGTTAFISLFSDFKKPTNNFDFSYKASFTSLEASKNNILLNEFYTSARYKKVQLDLGVKHPEVLWEGLSSSNGNIMMSGNARSLPGYTFSILNYVKLPFAKKWLSVKGNYGDYLMNDTRYINNTRLHSKSVYFKSKLSTSFELITGINHYAQWAGTSIDGNKQPSSFKDYLRIISGSAGGSGAGTGDQINALGNHLGSYLLQLNHTGEKLNWNFYYSHLFEDRSGREMMNYPDALYGLFIDFKKEKALVTHLLAEFTYTQNVSGTSPHYKDETGYHAGSGLDQYFDNYVYQSGWTYFGNTIGSPYFTAETPDEDGITYGVIFRDRRYSAFNVGTKGFIGTSPYKAMLSHVTYVGSHAEPYNPKLKQLSGLFEIQLPTINKFPFNITLGSAFDTGTYRPVSFGGFLKISKNGLF